MQDISPFTETTDMGASLLKKSFQAYCVFMSHMCTCHRITGQYLTVPDTWGLKNLAQVISLITGVSTAEPSCQPRVYAQQEGKSGKNI